MEKNEILEASRKENKNQDIYELEIKNQSTRLGGIVGVAVAAFLFIITIDYYKPVAFGFYMVYTSARCTEFLYEFIKLKKKSLLFSSIGMLIISILCLIQYSKMWQGN